MIMDSIINKINYDIPLPENTTIVDGLLHCGVCGDALEKNIKALGLTYRVRCICKCQQEEREKREQAEKLANIEKEKDSCFGGRKINKNMTFSNCTQNEHVKKMAMYYSNNFDGAQQIGAGILFYGGVGTGKTFFACCIANSLIERGYKVKFITISELLNQERAIENRTAIISSLTKCDLVIIDDFGIERKTEYAKEWTYDVIDFLYTRKKCVIVTTNMTKEELVSTSDVSNARVCDRLLSMCTPYEVNGTSIRRQNLVNNKNKEEKQ